jgi:hypothetical protein
VLIRHIVHVGKGRRTIWMRVSLLHNRKELPTKNSPPDPSRAARLTCLKLAVQQESGGAQAIFNLRRFLTIICLQAGEHEF